MSEEQKKAEDNMDEEEEGGINLFDYLIVLAKRKKLILSITLSVAVIAFVPTFIYNRSVYSAFTTILPPRGESRSAANQLVRDLGLLPQVSGADYSNQELLVEIIKSRTFTSRIIERFNLKIDDDEGYSDKLLNRMGVNIDPDPTAKPASVLKKRHSMLIKINVQNKDAQKAADIANGIVDELQLFINNLAISEASKKRLFFEEQLKHARQVLIKSEDDMKAFQQKTGLLTAESQTDISIRKIADLEAQITAKEIELQVMRSYSTSNNPDLQRIESIIKALKNELTKLEADKNNGKNLLIPTGTMPSLGLEYKRKFRQLKFSETLYEILVKQYEMAKVQEASDPILIQVIDKAVPSEKPAEIRLFGRKNALSVTLVAFLLSCLWVFYSEFREKACKNERLETLKKYLSFEKNS